MDISKDTKTDKATTKPKAQAKGKVGRPKGSCNVAGKNKSITKGTHQKPRKKRSTPQKPKENDPKSPEKTTSPQELLMEFGKTPPTNNVTTTYKPTQDILEENDQVTTLKTSETPPEESTGLDGSSTFKSVLIDTLDTPMTDRLARSTFLIQKELSEVKNIPEDDSTVEKDNFTISEFPYSVRTTMMFKLPPKTGDTTEEDGPISSIRKMNQMVKALTNKLPCRLGPWKMKDNRTFLKITDLITELPEDIDFVETYVYDFNRFLAFGKNGYVRLNFFYSESTSLPEIEQVISQFKIPRVQFLEKAHSDALVPTTVGTLTGSVEAMATSRDFRETFMHKFSLNSLGLWWGIPRQGKRSEYNGNKAVLHLEIDRKDYAKRKDIEIFFNYTSSGLDNHFFGVPMLLTSPFHYFANDDEKANLEMHSRKQVSLSKAISSTTISGIGLNNWANGEKTSTLLRELMSVESTTKKQIVKGKKTTTFLGRLFYAIIPNRDSKSTTFYFTKANAPEGRSVARGLPHFIRDFFKLEPAFFCTSTALTEAMDGDWTFSTRKFLSAQEKMEIDRLEDMDEEVNAVPIAYISKEHQQALAMDNDEVSVETRLTKGDAAPTPAITIKDAVDDQSEMTGSTRESKAKKYADEAVKEVINEYSGTIINMSSDLEQKDSRIAQLEMMLKNMNNASLLGTKESPITMPADGTTGQDNTSPPAEDNTNLSFSSSSVSDNDTLTLTSSKSKTETDPPSSSTQLTRLKSREKRKLSQEEENSQDDTSRSTRAKTSLTTHLETKTSSSDEAESL